MEKANSKRAPLNWVIRYSTGKAALHAKGSATGKLLSRLRRGEVVDDGMSRPYDCGIHMCTKSCHPPSLRAPPCPRSTSSVTHCPCGKHLLTDLVNGHRDKCTDPISTCGSICMKPLGVCQHVCAVKCTFSSISIEYASQAPSFLGHEGPCPPCTIPIITPCRCGSTTRPVLCSDSHSASAHQEILCDRPCPALRSCGRHQCSRLCCPLASLAALNKLKGKKRQQVQNQADEAHLDEEGWHVCDLVCGKMLGCGNHRCEERDHRGACPPCLRSSFEEVRIAGAVSKYNLGYKTQIDCYDYLCR